MLKANPPNIPGKILNSWKSRCAAAFLVGLLAVTAAPTFPGIAPGTKHLKANHPETLSARQMKAHALLQQKLSAPRLPLGDWEFAGLNWAMSSQAPAPLPEDFTLNRFVPTPGNQLSEFDRKVKQLIHALLVSGTLDPVSNRITYQYKSDSLNGVAITANVGGQEVPLAVKLWWPAGPQLWTEFRAHRLGNQSEDRWPLEPRLPGNVLARQHGASDNIECLLVDYAGTFPDFQTRLAVDGWRFAPFPGEKSTRQVVWAHYDDQCFEFSCTREIRGGRVLVTVRKTRCVDAPQPTSPQDSTASVERQPHNLTSL